MYRPHCASQIMAAEYCFRKAYAEKLTAIILENGVDAAGAAQIDIAALRRTCVESLAAGPKAPAAPTDPGTGDGTTAGADLPRLRPLNRQARAWAPHHLQRRSRRRSSPTPSAAEPSPTRGTSPAGRPSEEDSHPAGAKAEKAVAAPATPRLRPNHLTQPSLRSPRRGTFRVPRCGRNRHHRTDGRPGPVPMPDPGTAIEDGSRCRREKRPRAAAKDAPAAARAPTADARRHSEAESTSRSGTRTGACRRGRRRQQRRARLLQ